MLKLKQTENDYGNIPYICMVTSINKTQDTGLDCLLQLSGKTK